MLTPMTDLLADAAARGYAVGSFEVPNLEAACGVIDAAAESNSPVILAIAEDFFRFQPFAPLVVAMRVLAASSKQPVTILLDHAVHFDVVVQGVQAGVTAIMFDASRLPLTQNIASTAEVVKLCHAVGIAVEGEVGAMPEGETLDDSALAGTLTQPEDAIRFVEETGVDALAVAVGTAHGHYKGTPHIDQALLATIADTAPCPLVLHGGSSTGDERLRAAIEHGIRKVNVYTDASVAAYRACAGVVNDAGQRERIEGLIVATREAFRATACQYMEVFGSTGKY